MLTAATLMGGWARRLLFVARGDFGRGEISAWARAADGVITNRGFSGLRGEFQLRRTSASRRSSRRPLPPTSPDYVCWRFRQKPEASIAAPAVDAARPTRDFRHT